MAGKIEKRSLSSLHSAKSPTFSILTYNIHTSPETPENTIIRMRVIAKMIVDHMPDVVCLLDVTPLGFQTVKRLLENYYILFQVFIEENNKTGEVLLCSREKTHIVDGTQPYYYDFNVGKGRIIGTELYLKAFDRCVHILLTKLDEKQEDIRTGQYEIIKQVLLNSPEAILVGDFNLQSINEPIEGQLNQLSDAWLKMGCPGCLRAPNKNRDIRSTRVYYTEEAQLVTTGMSLMGTATIKKLDRPPSDHYGVLSSFTSK
jgi:endonuclease/exonuclease/phosphatase family metal-dependent hydrolase